MFTPRAACASITERDLPIKLSGQSTTHQSPVLQSQLSSYYSQLGQSDYSALNNPQPLNPTTTSRKYADAPAHSRSR